MRKLGVHLHGNPMSKGKGKPSLYVAATSGVDELSDVDHVSDSSSDTISRYPKRACVSTASVAVSAKPPRRCGGRASGPPAGLHQPFSEHSEKELEFFIIS